MKVLLLRIQHTLTEPPALLILLSISTLAGLLLLGMIPALKFHAVLEGLGLIWATSGLILTSSILRQHYVTQLQSANRQIIEQTTNHKRTMELLVASEKRNRLLLEHARVGIGYFDAAGTILALNAKALEHLGGISDDYTGRSVIDVFGPISGQRMLDRIATALRTADNQDYEDEIPVSRGTMWFLSTFANITDAAGSSIGVQIVSHDITERKRAEQREKDLFAEREKVHVMEAFIDDLSHDFRTSLTVINTNIYLLHKRLSDEIYRKQIDLMQKHSNRLIHMVDDMFEMFELDMQMALPMAPVNLADVLNAAAARYQQNASEKKQTLLLELPDTLPLIWGHAPSLKRVVTSLIANAIQFTSPGGTITLRGCLDDQHVSIEVRDTGIGICDADKPHLFKRFFRANKTRPTHNGGTGLGLPIAQAIVERHQGQIEVESVEHEGSTFRVVLPRCDQPAVIL